MCCVFFRENAENGVCTYSLHGIASITGYSVRMVKYAIRDLLDREAIEVVRCPGERRNSYRVRGAL
jgi:DNA-binding transcriptional regulator GbsR (MarR family)